MSCSTKICSIEVNVVQAPSTIASFYEQILELRAHDSGEKSIEFAFRESIVKFKIIETRSCCSAYHFAFNISENKIGAARDCLAERVELIETPPEFRDPAHAPEVRWFEL